MTHFSLLSLATEWRIVCFFLGWKDVKMPVIQNYRTCYFSECHASYISVFYAVAEIERRNRVSDISPGSTYVRHSILFFLFNWCYRVQGAHSNRSHRDRSVQCEFFAQFALARFPPWAVKSGIAQSPNSDPVCPASIVFSFRDRGSLYSDF